MKILIGYDGSECARAAMSDLKNAGLPDATDAVVLSVTENWALSGQELENGSPTKEAVEDWDSKTIRRIREKKKAAFTEIEKMAQGAANDLQKNFPLWIVHSNAVLGFAHWGILEKADEWRPDLIVVGSHGRNLVGRLVLGSSSLKILTEARCSVRIARWSPARTADDNSPIRIVLGLDCSPDSQEAVEAIARRKWQAGTAVRLVTAIEPISIATVGFALTPKDVDRSIVAAREKLRTAKLHVSTVVRVGDAKRVLLDESEKWAADAIFVGAKGHGFVERAMLGSVSYAVVARAHCSVEVVRS